MEMGFGGPVWHASVQSITMPLSRRLALEALTGVGDASLGEWLEDGNKGVAHVRRRLSAREAALIPGMEDIRGTDEEASRLTRLLSEAPHLRGWIEHYYPHVVS